MGNKVAIFDSSLRDGAQAEGISFSVEDKLKILALLDEHGVDYIEAGNPGSNPKDLEFFARAKSVVLKHAKLAAFGSTRRRGITAEADDNVQSMLLADTPVIVIFGKSWDFHVTDIIRTTLDENLAMISDTLAFFKARGKEVIFDAEHFFDGYLANPDYAVKSLQAAVDGGADALVLCDTNGGTFPSAVAAIVKQMADKFSVPIGIHAHNDCGMAGRQQRDGRRERRAPRAGHLYRFRRTLRQRQPVDDHRQPRRQGRLRLSGRPISTRTSRASRATSRRSPTSRSTSATPSSATVPSRTRAACTSTASTRQRTRSSTSTRNSSAASADS